MTEKIIYLNSDELLYISGINNTKLKRIISAFPKVKIIARGNELKLLGEEGEILNLENKISTLLEHFEKHNHITDEQFDNLLNLPHHEVVLNHEGDDDILLYGNSGKPLRAQTYHQKQVVNDYKKNDLIIAVGPAGSGKTYIAIALAVRALRDKQVKKIILSRPAVEAEEHLGFLPGDMKDKLDPYLQPLYDALNDMIPARRLADYFRDGIVQIAPLAFMRGRTLSNAFVILDEAQNTTINQLKMFLTRMGRNSKFIITGDITQIDLPKKQKSGLLHSHKLLKNIDGISIIDFDARDIIRHKLVKSIVNAYDQEEKESM